jgi:hypothetical protein
MFRDPSRHGSGWRRTPIAPVRTAPTHASVARRARWTERSSSFLDDSSVHGTGHSVDHIAIALHRSRDSSRPEPRDEETDADQRDQAAKKWRVEHFARFRIPQQPVCRDYQQRHDRDENRHG